MKKTYSYFLPFYVQIKNLHHQVDDESSIRAVRGSDYLFGHFANNSAVFVGGISDMVSVDRLTLPWVMFETRFRGSIRNVMYASDERGVSARAQRHEEGSGLRLTTTLACDQNDPCQHAGICVSTDNGPLCDCRLTDYEGTFCQKGEFDVLDNI